MLHMELPQNTKNRSPEEIYYSFRKRVKQKSEDPYFDNGTKPVLLRLHFMSSSIDSVGELRVEYNSFKKILGKSEKAKNKEIGFKATLFMLFEKKVLLKVLKNGRAYIEYVGWVISVILVKATLIEWLFLFLKWQSQRISNEELIELLDEVEKLNY